MNSAQFRRALLATSSVAALAVGGVGAANAACTPGTSSGYTNPSGTTITCLDFNNTITPTVTGTAVNAGTIHNSGGDGISVQVSTFTGAVSNSGSISAKSSGIVVTNGGTFSAGITNTGSITGSGNAIAVLSQSAFAGGIVNGGQILVSGSSGAGIFIDTVSTFAGGITNSGTISTQSSAVKIGGVSSFGGGISNSGHILVAETSGSGIYIEDVSAFTGGITNTGTVSSAGSGIVVNTVGSFAGGISNNGQITVTRTNTAAGIRLVSVSAFAGGITNSGTISAEGTGIAVYDGTSFLGGISNSGVIAGQTFAAISVNSQSVFTGGIANSGSLGGTVGILLEDDATFSGGITNIGTITTEGDAVRIDALTEYSGGIDNSGQMQITGKGPAVSVFEVSTFAGGIVNGGTISAGAAAIDVDTVGSFAGGISNSGSISTQATAISVFTVSSFAGGIANSGHILVAGSSSAGIRVQSVSAFTGGISNSGTITSGGTGIEVITDGSFAGGITNVGQILALGSSAAGIRVSGVQAFAGGISNSGIISSGSAGIVVAGGREAITSFAGGISNSGTITAAITAISVADVPTFVGGIINSGTLNAGGGVAVSKPLGIVGQLTIGYVAAGIGISVNTVSIFAGGITNSGTLTAKYTGIAVDGVGSFAGGIANSGMITAGGSSGAVVVSGGSVFAGGIINSGKITFAGTNGAAVMVGFGSTFAGGIANSGTITSNRTGIEVSTVSVFSGGIVNSGTVLAKLTGIGVSDVGNFSGGITNTGSLTGRTGLVVSGGSTFSGAIANSGNITGTGEKEIGVIAGPEAQANGQPVAINLAAAPNAMTINQTAGTITGAIRLSAFADVLNINGGTVNGNIVGQGASNTVNFALGTGTFTYASAYAIAGVQHLNANSGTVILDGTNSAAFVAVNAGELEVGDAANPGATLTALDGLTVAAGGTLAGHGTLIGSLAIPSGATLSPGGSIGTLSVTGNVSLAAGSFYDVTVNAADQGSKTVATGTATISGGTVVVMEQPGTYLAPIHYVILTANSGVSGTFAGATSDFAFLTPVLGYDADDVFLTLDRNATYFTSVGQTSNERGVGGALDASPLASALVGSVLTQTVAGAQQAENALSGEIYASMQSTLLDDTRLMREAMMGRLRQASYAGVPGTLGALAANGPQVAAAGGSPASPPAAAAFSSGVTFWEQSVGAFDQIAGNGNAARVNDTVGGIFLGLDSAVGNAWRLGVAGGYTHSSVDINARDSSASIDTAHFGAYAGTRLGAINLRAGAEYAWNGADTDRSVAFPGFFEHESGHPTDGSGQIFGEAGYSFALGPVAAEPFADLSYVHLGSLGVSETGGVAALNGSGSGMNVGLAALGVRVATSYVLGNGMVLSPTASLGWQHAFGSVTPTAALSFQSTGADFTVDGVPLARDQAIVGAGVDLRVTANVAVSLSYTGELSARAQDNAVKGNLTWNF